MPPQAGFTTLVFLERRPALGIPWLPGGLVALRGPRAGRRAPPARLTPQATDRSASAGGAHATGAPQGGRAAAGRSAAPPEPPLPRPPGPQPPHLAAPLRRHRGPAAEPRVRSHAP